MRECESHWRKNFLPYTRYVATIPCESLKHKSNTFHTNISTSHMFISITFTETSIDETNKNQQKVWGSKFMLKMSTIHGNTCIQTTTPLHNHWRFRWQSWCYAAALLGTRGVNSDYYRNTVLLNMLLPDIRSVFGDYYLFQQDGVPALILLILVWNALLLCLRLSHTIW